MQKENYERYDMKEGKKATAKECVENYKRLYADLRKLKDEKVALDAKAFSISDKRQALTEAIQEAENAVDEGLIDNVREVINDTEFDQLKEKVGSLKREFDDHQGKAGAIKVALQRNSAVQGKVKQSLTAARSHFIRASYRELAKKIKADQADLIADLWAILSSSPGSTYQSMLQELF